MSDETKIRLGNLGCGIKDRLGRELESDSESDDDQLREEGCFLAMELAIGGCSEMFEKLDE